jgi:hypothetical protein
MPNHHMVNSGDPEKGHDVTYGHEAKVGAYEEPFVHGAATVGAATGRGGDTHRGLKSRHIQFLYVQNYCDGSETWSSNEVTGRLEVLLELVFLSALEQFSHSSALLLSSWHISA